MNRMLVLAVAVLLLAGGILAFGTAWAIKRRSETQLQAEPVVVRSFGTQKIDSPRTQAAEWLTEFTLTERSGSEFSSRDLDGTVHVVNFFFASCPSYCRMQTAEVQKLAQEFGPKGVKFLSITCDPDRDTPQALKEYASLFNADPNQWLFLTGDLGLLRRVGAEMYSLPVDKETHTEHLVVVDRRGKVRGRFLWKNHPEELADLKATLDELLAETQPALEQQPQRATDEDMINEEDEEEVETVEAATLESDVTY